MPTPLSGKDTSKKLSVIRDDIIQHVRSTPISMRFQRGDNVRLYLEMPRHIDETPPFVRAVVIGVNITTKSVRYRLAFCLGEEWFTCNRYYLEKFIGKDHDAAPSVEFTKDDTLELLNSTADAVDKING